MVAPSQHPNSPAHRPFSHNVRTLAWIGLLMVGGASVVGCAAETSGDASADGAVKVGVDTGTAGTRIFGGDRDDDGASIPGVVALRVGTGGTFELCSGALVAPNVVLTARHCVTKNVSTTVSCTENGESANGPHVQGDEDPASIGIYTGADPSFAHAPIARARAVVAPTGQYLCDSDIALVVLDTPITTIAPLPVRLKSSAVPGELVRSVGYGQNDASAPIGTRFRKSVSVLAQGQAVTASKTPLGPHEFEVGKSICQGDSGGPAISEGTGAVIGVVSRGGDCDEDFGHIYTTTAGFSQLFDDAFALAGASPLPESGTITMSTAHLASSSDERPADASAQGGCSVTKSAGAGAGTGGMALVLAALGALGLRRRRAT
ncbi:MAG: hypothetical protein JWP97_5207 [Labilithrix sp.]|nr:hypothetical protein [Labilithrix sp.]